MDAHGQRAVLLPAAAGCAVPLVAIALLPSGSPLAVLVVLAVAAGMLHPPLGGATRALWPDLVPPERRHAIFALESAAIEMTFIVGPLVLVGVVAAITSPSVGLVACAALLVGGTGAFAALPGTRRRQPSDMSRTLAGALASPALLVLLATPSPALPALAPVAAGACIAPAFATLYAMVADVARKGTLTESYTWLMTCIAGGVAAGLVAGASLVMAAGARDLRAR